jgi:carbamoyltransferase
MNILFNTSAKNRYNRDVFVAPNSSDCGLSFGLLMKYMKPTKIIDITYKGIGILDKNILIEESQKRNCNKTNLNQIINDLSNNKILGIIQNNSEHGPRALGNRSIICSPISLDMKDILNFKVKHREWFRPFAPIVRLEDVSKYFEWEGESRWMNFCPKVRLEYIDKIPAVVHVDGTARVQTITREQNEFIYDLLTLFEEKTGIGVLLNTSFNIDGKPILSTYKDAFKVFDETQLDRLYLNGYYFSK